jgi:hypothetical protein
MPAPPLRGRRHRIGEEALFASRDKIAVQRTSSKIQSPNLLEIVRARKLITGGGFLSGSSRARRAVERVRPSERCGMVRPVSKGIVVATVGRAPQREVLA